jgi:DNA-binding transcriptional MerR regulator
VDKSPDAFLTIGEMADRLGVKTHILRYWEEQFPMLNPLKRAGGRRLYRPDDVRLVQQIDDLLHKQGYTIKGARQFLAGGGAKPDGAPAVVMSTQPTGSSAAPSAEMVQRLRAVRQRLADALAAA